MFCDDGIIWGQLVCLLEFNHRPLVVPEFEIGPAQTVGDIAHIGF